MNVYIRTNIPTSKIYIGSVIDIFNGLGNYYNISYLERETNDSMDLDLNKGTIEMICTSKLGHYHSKTDKLAVVVGNIKVQSVFVFNNKTGENKKFVFIRKAVEFVSLHRSYIAKFIKISNGKYIREDCSIIKK